jgi:hypothetical protein
MTIENRTSQLSLSVDLALPFSFDMKREALRRVDKLIVSVEPRPQRFHLHEHTHIFNRRDAENNIVRRVGSGNIDGRVLESF